MDAGRQQRDPRDKRDTDRVAIGRPEGAGTITFADAAAQLLDSGYEPIPIKPGQKVPALSRWSNVTIDDAAIENWRVAHASCSVGLRTGLLIGLDIDELDPDRAHAAQALAETPVALSDRDPVCQNEVKAGRDTRTRAAICRLRHPSWHGQTVFMAIR